VHAAGAFARQLGARALVLTHFSGRFMDFRGRVRAPF
jgi:ribonuclease BN (tRNA processing enzyme)